MQILDYFNMLSKYPRASGKEKLVSDFVVDFAKERNLEVFQDKLWNVIIKKKATVENYSGPAVILQGHLDMVYEKEQESSHVYDSGIEVEEKDGFLQAKGTTLGADNGIAVAYCLALLDSTQIPHPDLEIVFTVQEEVGLVGAQNLDCTHLQGKMMINLDSEEEGVFCTSCAGGVRNHVKIPVQREQKVFSHRIELTVSGLLGGHSGMDIDLERGNAAVLMGRLLQSIDGIAVGVTAIDCPGKANVIPNYCRVNLAVAKTDLSDLTEKIENMTKALQKELAFADPGLQVRMEKSEAKDQTIAVLTEKTKNSLVALLTNLPYGVLNRSTAIPGLVQTSSNIGSVEEQGNEIVFLLSVRSSVQSQKEFIRKRIETTASAHGAVCTFFNDYPQWTYREKSPLRDLIARLYRQMYGKEAEFTAIHAGLECGYFDEKLEDVDMISMGPNLYDVHTTKERLDIQSAEHVWQFLQELLKELVQ